MKNTTKFLESIQQKINDRHLLKHPFLSGMGKRRT